MIVGPRVGGTLLAHCLSTHPQVFFARDEPLVPGSSWSRLGCGPAALLGLLLAMPWYQASGCRVLYSQMHTPEVRDYLLSVRPRVVWLRRRDVLGQAFSLMMYAQGQTHSVEIPVSQSVWVSPKDFVNQVRNLVERNARGAERVAEFEVVLPLWYEDICPDDRGWLPEPAAAKVCGFLGVKEEPMRTDLKRIHRPLPEAVANWPEVLAAVRDSEFAVLEESVCQH